MQRSREYLYERFENNQKPNRDDFRDLIDSSVSLQDDSINTGWYYFRFLPHASSRRLSRLSINTYREFHADQLGTFTGITGIGPRDVCDGFMNILLPKGVGGIDSFSVTASMDIQEIERIPPISLKIWLFALSKNTIRELPNSGARILFSVEITEDVVGLHPIHRDYTIADVPVINPEDDALYLRVTSDPQHDSNVVTIKVLGIHYTR